MDLRNAREFGGCAGNGERCEGIWRMRGNDDVRCSGIWKMRGNRCEMRGNLENAREMDRGAREFGECARIGDWCAGIWKMRGKRSEVRGNLKNAREINRDEELSKLKSAKSYYTKTPPIKKIGGVFML